MITCATAAYAQSVKARSAEERGKKIKFKRLTTENGLPNDGVWGITRDSHGFMWFGTFDGLARYDGNRVKTYRHERDDPYSLSGNAVKEVHSDHKGVLWAGTWGDGLNRFDRETEGFIRFRHDPDDPRSLSDNTILTIYEDRAGTLWIGTLAGLNKYDRETREFTRYRHDPADPNTVNHDNVGIVYEDRAGVLWIGSLGGLNRLEPGTGKITRYRHDPADPDTLSQNSVTAICEDRRGDLWIGTLGGGLDKFDREHERFVHHTSKEGLPSDSVFGIKEDDANGDLWLSTTRGLSCFDPLAKTFRNYDVNDGLQGNSFFALGAQRKGRDGELFFGGSNGMNAFFPEQIKDNPHIPPVVITDFRLANKPVSIGGDSVLKKSILETGHLTLSYRDRVFSFEFAALNYRASEKNRYKYKMEGFETEWNESDRSRPFAVYTNLDPGD